MIGFAGDAEQSVQIATVTVHQLAVFHLDLIQRTGAGIQQTVTIGLFRIVTHRGSVLFRLCQDILAGIEVEAGARILQSLVGGCGRKS